MFNFQKQNFMEKLSGVYGDYKISKASKFSNFQKRLKL